MSDYVYSVAATARDRYNSTKSAHFTVNGTTRIKQLVAILIEDVDGYFPAENILEQVVANLMIHRSATHNNVELEMEVM